MPGEIREKLRGPNPEPRTLNPEPSISPMAKRSTYQNRVIKNYYQNQNAIMLQRLGDLVTDLYLAQGKAKDRLWKRVGAALKNLKIPPNQIEPLVRSDNPMLVANLLKKLLETK